MARPPPKLPRRHTQRQALNHGRAKTPPSGLPSRERPRSHKPPAKKEKKSSASSDDDSDSDSSSDSDNDSGYNSAADLDAKAEYYRQKRAGFKAAGPAMPKRSDDEKDVQAEGRKWEL